MPNAKQTKVPVTMRALTQRIDRMLAAGGKRLKAAGRNERIRETFGDFFVLDLYTSAVTQRHLDPEKFGREHGLMQPWETLAD